MGDLDLENPQEAPVPPYFEVFDVHHACNKDLFYNTVRTAACAWRAGGWGLYARVSICDGFVIIYMVVVGGGGGILLQLLLQPLEAESVASAGCDPQRLVRCVPGRH